MHVWYSYPDDDIKMYVGHKNVYVGLEKLRFYKIKIILCYLRRPRFYA